MLPTARIVVIDDDERDVRAIVNALTMLETSAVGIHYTAEKELPNFPCLRILFLDLHLQQGALDTVQQAKYTVDLLSQFLSQKNGPYVIVLWSAHATDKDLFESTLTERLPSLGITAPLAILPLDKIDYLHDHVVKDPSGLREAVLGKIRETPQLAALLGWEEHVAQAANDTVCQVFRMALQDSGGPTAGLNRILGELAVASAGIEGARDDSFRSANEVLVQIVSDRLLHRGVDSSLSQQWRTAVTDFRSKSSLENADAARLNSLLHFEAGKTSSTPGAYERGSVLDLSSLAEGKFLRIWGSPRLAIREDFCLKDSLQEVQWIAIQVRPACDEAQRHTGLLPYVLGIRILSPSNTWLDKVKKADCLWLSPALAAETDQVYRLLFHLRFVAGFHQEFLKQLGLPCFCRLREPLMTALTHDLHSYGGRPGLIRFPR